MTRPCKSEYQEQTGTVLAIARSLGFEALLKAVLDIGNSYKHRPSTNLNLSQSMSKCIGCTGKNITWAGVGMILKMEPETKN